MPTRMQESRSGEKSQGVYVWSPPNPSKSRPTVDKNVQGSAKYVSCESASRKTARSIIFSDLKHFQQIWTCLLREEWR